MRQNIHSRRSMLSILVLNVSIFQKIIPPYVAVAGVRLRGISNVFTLFLILLKLYINNELFSNFYCFPDKNII